MTDEELSMTDEEMQARFAELDAEARAEEERERWASIATERPEFGRLQQVDHKDDYRLAINGELVTGLTWAHIGKWTLVQDEHNRQFPEHALLWEPDHRKSQAEIRLEWNTRRSRRDYNPNIATGEDEWAVIRMELLHNVEHVRSESELTPSTKSLVVLKAWLLRAPKVPAQPDLRWRDKRYGVEASYVFTSDAAVKVIQRAGCDLTRGEILELLRELGGKSESIHVPAPYNRVVRAYRLAERRLQRLKVPELAVDPDYIPGVEMSEIEI